MEQGLAGSYRDVFSGSRGRLAAGLLTLEFVASVQVFMVATILPQVARDLDGMHLYGVALTAASLSVFLALPFMSQATSRYGTKVVLNVSAVGYIVGGLLCVLAPSMLVFALGRCVQGAASGALASFGLSTVIAEFPEELRPRLIALMSAMWLVPAMVGPTLSVAVTTLFGWRYSLLLLIPIVLAGRFLVIRRISLIRPASGTARRMTLPATLLIVAGLALLTAGGAGVGATLAPWLIPVGVVLALVGGIRSLPKGVVSLRHGRPAALAAFFLISFAFMGGDGLITLLASAQDPGNLGVAGAALASGTIAWVFAALLEPRLLERMKSRYDRVALLSAGIFAVGLAMLLAAVALNVPGPAFAALCIGGWAVSGAGMGLGYPTLSVASLRVTADEDPSEAANSVIVTESLAGALGLALGGALVSTSASLVGSVAPGLLLAYAAFLAAVALLAVAATRVQRRS